MSKLVQHALTPSLTSLGKPYQSAEQREDLPTLREMINHHESSEYQQVFLSNKLCK